jgi:hypothetical protein
VLLQLGHFFICASSFELSTCTCCWAAASRTFCTACSACVIGAIALPVSLRAGISATLSFLLFIVTTLRTFDARTLPFTFPAFSVFASIVVTGFRVLEKIHARSDAKVYKTYQN